MNTGLEISWGSQWVNLNDHLNYVVNAEQTRDSAQKTWRRVESQSPVLGGKYLIHAVPEMITENVSLWIYGGDQAELADNYFGAIELFEQYSFQLRWTFDDYIETWDCQLADTTSSRNHVWSHNLMATASFAIPRFPDVTRRRIG